MVSAQGGIFGWVADSAAVLAALGHPAVDPARSSAPAPSAV
jgi:hypothetical protein